MNYVAGEGQSLKDFTGAEHHGQNGISEVLDFRMNLWRTNKGQD